MRKLYIAIILLFATNAFGAPSVCITGEYTIPEPVPGGTLLAGDATDYTGTNYNFRYGRAYQLLGSGNRYYTATASGTAKYAYIKFQSAFTSGNWRICAWDTSNAIIECTTMLQGGNSGLNKGTFNTGFPVTIGDHIYLTPIFSEYTRVECSSGSGTYYYDSMGIYDEDIEPTWDNQGSATISCDSFTIYIESE